MYTFCCHNRVVNPHPNYLGNHHSRRKSTASTKHAIDARGITLKHVTSGRARLRTLAPEQQTPKKRRSGGELLMTLYPT